jgi:hypothetical protein
VSEPTGFITTLKTSENDRGSVFFSTSWEEVDRLVEKWEGNGFEIWDVVCLHAEKSKI